MQITAAANFRTDNQSAAQQNDQHGQNTEPAQRMKGIPMPAQDLQEDHNRGNGDQHHSRDNAQRIRVTRPPAIPQQSRAETGSKRAQILIAGDGDIKKLASESGGGPNYSPYKRHSDVTPDGIVFRKRLFKQINCDRQHGRYREPVNTAHACPERRNDDRDQCSEGIAWRNARQDNDHAYQKMIIDCALKQKQSEPAASQDFHSQRFRSQAADQEK